MAAELPASCYRRTCTADPALEGELQVQWDRTLEKLPNLLVLVGSDVAMMERLASDGRPMFGRLQPLVVPALSPGELSEALLGRSALEVLDSYLVTGGYPRLVADLASGRSQTAHEYVRMSLADVYSPLVTTARLSLEAEFPDAPTAYQVLSAIGSDDTARPGFSDVLSATSDPAERKRAETATTRALRTLTETKTLIEREMPARLALRDANLAGVETVQPWWVRDGSIEVDVVAATSTATALVGTIKWRAKGQVTAGEIDELRRHRARVPRSEAALLAAISPSGSAPREADIAYTAADLLAAWG